MKPAPEELNDAWELVPESECDDQDDYPDDETIRREIAGWQESVASWEQGTSTREISILGNAKQLSLRFPHQGTGP